MRIAVYYLLFALVATLANLGAQDGYLRLHRGGWAIPLSIAVGTVVGLVVKYVLDKRYIFCFRARHAAHDLRTFSLYAVMGLLTTGIFWGVEAAFHFWFSGDDAMRYAGGALGLGIGYLIKYRLDKRFVFTGDE